MTTRLGSSEVEFVAREYIDAELFVSEGRGMR